MIPPKFKKRFSRSVFRQLESSVADEPINLEGFSFYLPGTLSQRLNVVGSDSNATLRKLWASFLKPGMNAMDVGANVGYHTIVMAAAVGQPGKVYAVEPLPANVEMLKRNVHVNGLNNVTVLPFAAGARAESHDLYIRDSGFPGQNNSLYSEYIDEIATLERIESVQVMPLDQLIEGDIAVAKIDIEGAEVEALEGMSANTAKSVDCGRD